MKISSPSLEKRAPLRSPVMMGCKFPYLLALVLAMILLTRYSLGNIMLSGYVSGIPSSIVANFSKYVFSSVGLFDNQYDTLKIDINYLGIDQIRRKREEALKRGVIVSNSSDYQNATVSLDDEKYKAKIRLKGDLIDHLQHEDKWSFKIKLAKNDFIYGKRKFVLQHPYTRKFQSETLLFSIFDLIGIPHPLYKFVNVTLNGNDLGIMAFEESFNKEFIESNKRREGVIIRFDEGDLWDNRVFTNDIDNNWFSYPNVDIDVYQMSKVNKKPNLLKQYSFAKKLLADFKARKLQTHEVFDIDLMGKYFAALDIWGSDHAIVWTNQRFYYNPITSLLEPIGFDTDGHNFYKQSILSDAKNKHRFVFQLFEDKLLVESYKNNLKHLLSILDDNQVNRLISTENDIYKRLSSEFIFLRKIDWALFRDRIKDISSRLDRNHSNISNNRQDSYDKVLTLEKVIDDTGSFIRVVNRIPHQVKVTNVTLYSKGVEYELAREVREKFPFFLDAIPNCAQSFTTNQDDCPYSDGFQYSEAYIKISKRMKDGFVPMVYATYQGNNIIEKGFKSFYYKSTVNSMVDPLMIANRYDFVEYNDKTKELTIDGEGVIDKSIILPVGVSVRILPGAILKFTEGKVLYIRGKFIVGNENNSAKSKLISYNQLEKWGGIIVESRKMDKVEIYNLEVQNIKDVDLFGKKITGAFTIYGADILINGLYVGDIIKEDAINIVNSKFNIRSLSVENVISDAIDIDFSNGNMKNISLDGVGSIGGGDGIDFSGSDCHISDIKANHIDDKAISIGEGSKIKVDNIDITNSNFGIAIKDGSEAHIKTLKLNNINETGVMAYVKKREYKAPKVFVSGIESYNVNRLASSHQKSTVEIDKATIPRSDIDVDELYKTIMKSNMK